MEETKEQTEQPAEKTEQPTAANTDILSEADYEQLQSAAPSQAPAISQISPEAVKQAAAGEILKIQNLMRAGVIDPLKGQTLANHVIQRAYEMVTTQQGAMPPAENDAFFRYGARSEVLDYLKKSGVVNKDEISRITGLVERIEKSAVENYLRKTRYEKTLNDENKTAKQKLRANAQKMSTSGNTRGVFTREQIGNMSGAEFAKHERAIMEQLRKGQIR